MIDVTENNKKAPKSLGLYIHIPFCRTKCLYCDFCSFVSKDEAEREAYVCALLREIESRSAKEYTVDTVYLGGGTPSLLSAEQVGRILSAVRENFTVANDVEITLECNPALNGQLSSRELRPCRTADYFAELKKLGVNRLSLGIQSAIDSELKLIGRRHSFEEAKNTYFDARSVGFDNISVDLMLGIPSQTLESLKKSLECLLALFPEHISIYSLQLEEGTPLYRMREKYDLADDDTAADMYEQTVRMMKESGYCHYEISNFSRVGKESRHNGKYWTLNEYLGFGLSAHSDFAGKRAENTRDINKYLAGEYLQSESAIGKSERELEFLMLGLRTSKGILKAEFFERFSADFDEKYGETVEKFKSMGYLGEAEGRVFLNERGFEVSNAILAELLNFDY